MSVVRLVTCDCNTALQANLLSVDNHNLDILINSSLRQGSQITDIVHCQIMTHGHCRTFVCHYFIFMFSRDNHKSVMSGRVDSDYSLELYG